MDMNEDNYKLIPWTRYWLPDNGVYGPIGSKPYFHVESDLYERMTNPLHPFALGVVLHNDMPDDCMPGMQKIFIHEIREQFTRQDTLDHVEMLNKKTREKHGK